MSWWKASIIGCCVYWGIFLISFTVFVLLGLGYSMPKLANIISEILAFPTGTGKNGNILLSMLFWTVVIAIAIKIVKK